MEAIRCEQLSRTYGEVQALKPLDLTVPEGVIFGFLGRNGAGKTTTIRLITGLAQPTTGAAWVNGLATTQTDGTAKQQFGYLPQEPAFYTWMTPREYLDYSARIFRIDSKGRGQRIEELLELVGLADVAKRPIHGFSGGMKQRLGLAQALIHRPPVLILDEPMAGMDPAGRRDVIELLDGLRGQVTVFFSSHILADVDRVCDQIAILHEGELLLVADRAELLARYATNAIFLELAHESRDRQDELAARLQAEAWVTGVLVENSGLRLVVTDTAVARQSLLPLLVQQGVVLNKYEWIRPSLEDVFLAISS
ncbi:MAG: ABC transporter ATP-binding protein [Ardenticatenaceae bacterium]|nr:ABC transporter ATP-binding protein [Ardenticatenaceae bacterium]MCB9444987.1 ABC transporter ATP-binding protein [Ardenticatenaceae bacterium]